MANAIKQHGDVDVFVMVKDDSTMKVFNAVWKFLQQEADDNGELDIMANGALFHGYQRSFRDILAIVNFGDVQLIFRYYTCECECDYHVDKSFFEEFHHCTRWKLDVFKDCKVARYIHLEDHDDGGEIICKETSLTLQYEKMVILTWESIFESKTYPKKYPNKHADNDVDFGPPKLKQQALHHILRRRRRKQQQQQTTSCCCSRKRKWEEAADDYLLMCSEQMSIDDDE